MNNSRIDQEKKTKFNAWVPKYSRFQSSMKAYKMYIFTFIYTCSLLHPFPIYSTSSFSQWMQPHHFRLHNNPLSFIQHCVLVFGSYSIEAPIIQSFMDRMASDFVSICNYNVHVMPHKWAVHCSLHIPWSNDLTWRILLLCLNST